MKLEHEDPRVIDYVLGELPEDERAAIRAALAEAENAEAAAFAREISGFKKVAGAVLQVEADESAAQAATPAPIREARPDSRRPQERKAPFGLSFILTVSCVILFLASITFTALPRMGGRESLSKNHFEEQKLMKLMSAEVADQPVRVSPDDLKKLTYDLSELPASTITRGADVGGAVAAPAPATAAAPPVAGAPNLVYPTTAPRPKLQDVEVGGGIRKRGEWAFEERGRAQVAAAEEKTRFGLDAGVVEDPGITDQLRALGYGLTDSDGDGIHDSGRSDGAGGFGGGYPRPALQLTLPITFKSVLAEPLSTFAADVDTASYTLIRRDLQGGQLPAPQRVRTEEFINYFDYAYPEPTGEHPFSVTVDVAACPWAPSHRLARVGIKGKAMDARERVAANLVFLVDVSGSMDSPDKLPLVRESLRGLLETLKESDRVALVTYAGESRVVLEPTSCEQKDKIRAAIDSLGAGGSTNGAGGITAAYEQARRAFIEKGINRVLIATDGDFNVGATSQRELERLITQQAKSGVFLSVLGYGTGNLNDATLETLADKGNGFYAYIDDIGEARRVLVEKGLSAIATIAKDVKFQIEFNPAKVGHYRQIGYENRQLAAQDFNDDTKDAGDIGPGHTVTTLYELVPAGQSPTPGVDPLKYQQTEPTPVVNNSPESMTVKLRYKQPDAQTSQLLELPVLDSGTAFDAAPQDFQFASAVAAFAQVLKGLQLAQPPTLEQIRTIADATKGNDPARQEFVDLVVTTKTLVR